MLATQNPVDLDYKGLANTGTWFIGRLQTERDKTRVLEGLTGALLVAASTAPSWTRLLARLTQRVFLMRNVHDDAPVLLNALGAVLPARPADARGDQPADRPRSPPRLGLRKCRRYPAPAPHRPRRRVPPVVPPEVTGALPRPKPAPWPRYRANVGARVRTHFVDAKAGLDAWQNTLPRPDHGTVATGSRPRVSRARGPALSARQPRPRHSPMTPAAAHTPRDTRWRQTLEDDIYHNDTLDLMTCPP